MNEQAAIEIGPGPPGYALAVAAPVVAIALVAYRASTSGLWSGPDDPVPPLLIAVITIGVGLAIGWRSLTQRARLGWDHLRCRNALVTFEVAWDDIERLDVVHRPWVVIVEVRIRGLRRRHRIGAATRLVGHEADAVLDMLRAHPVAASLMHDERFDDS